MKTQCEYPDAPLYFDCTNFNEENKQAFFEMSQDVADFVMKHYKGNSIQECFNNLLEEAFDEITL